MSDEVEFYYSNLSWESVRTRAFLETSGIHYKAVLSEFGSPPPYSIYGELPVLRHRGKVIEDHRLILLYIDEVFSERSLLGKLPKARIECLELIEHLDHAILSIITAPTLIDPALFKPLYLLELKSLGKSQTDQAWRSFRSKRLQSRFGISINKDALSSKFNFALSELSALVFKQSCALAVRLCIVSALEMLRGENLWWEKIVQEKVILSWLTNQDQPAKFSQQL